MKAYTHVFAMMPVEAFLDHRLSLIQLRILGAIFTWRDKNTNVAKVYRHQIRERCGYSDRTISENTSKLQKNGWLEKLGDGGRGLQTTYRVTVPELGTVPEPGTVPGPAHKRFPDRRKNGSRTGNTLQNNYRTTTEEGSARTDAEVSPGEPPKPKPKPKARITASDLKTDYDVPASIAAEFLQIRRDKRLTLTPTAMNRLCKQFEKAGLSVVEGIELCCERSWAGFNASWQWQDNETPRNGGSAAAHRQNLASQSMARLMQIAQGGG